VSTHQNDLTDDQRKDNLKQHDSLADGIVTTATALGGFNSLGLWAGTIKAESPFNALIYTLPILAFAATLLYALWGKYSQWDMDPATYGKLFATKQKRIQYAFICLMAGLLLLFLALLVYTGRAVF
jgi:hypothetical protein